MPRRPQQLALPFKSSHGGRRKGAGRPNRSGLQAHSRRARLDPRKPVHVTLKLRPGLPSLRRKDLFRCLRDAVKTARKSGFAVAHFAILSNHIHFILEPQSPSLARVFQSLCISFAKRLNKRLGAAGSVFNERYHVHVLATPREVRRALAYVLTNDEIHRARARGIKIKGDFEIQIDPFSSAHAFSAWKPLLGNRVKISFSTWPEDWIESWHAEILAPARSWLLKQGWMRAPA